MSDNQYQVAISFAGEQRAYAEALARRLSTYGIAYFYDAENAVALWGKNLAEEFQQIYGKKAQFVLMLISKEYIAKEWCRHERRSAMAEALRRNGEFILPVRFDDAWPDGIPTDIHYVNGSEKTPPEISAMIAEKLGISLFSGKASSIPPPRSTSWVGEASFDYESFNGSYVIGDDEYAFETTWSMAGSGSIHVYNDGANVNGVAIAYGISDLSELSDASALDFSSRHRRAKVGDIVVFRNKQGLYAALKIKNVTIRQAATPAELRFLYAINRDGSPDFSALDGSPHRSPE
jgi:hypothetical protein